MAKKEEHGTFQEHSGYVAVLIARSVEEAEHYCQLFNDHDIDAIMGDGDLDDLQAKCELTEGPAIGGVPVLVSEEMLDEAKEILADRENLDEFQAAGDQCLDEQEDEEEDFGFVEEELGEDLDEDEGLLYEEDASDYDQDDQEEAF